MRFTDEELAKIATWNPIAPGFDRDDATIEAHIRPILDRLTADPRLKLNVMQDGGLANYFGFLVYEAAAARLLPDGWVRDVPCVVVKLSLMAPVGVFGQSSFSECVKPWIFGCSNLGPEQVCDPAAPPDWISAAVVAATHEASPYQLVGREVTDQPLPSGVSVYEYCLCPEPWDRVFHALFADTD
jgi:hypothetical protein